MKKNEKIATAIGGSAAIAVAVLVGASIFTSINTAAQNAPQPTATAVVSLFEINGYAEAPAKPEPAPEPVVEVAPAPAPEPVVEEPAAPDYGTPVPWVADPNSREGGFWDTTACPSGRAYQAADGNQYCA